MTPGSEHGADVALALLVAAVVWLLVIVAVLA